jgi:hypothetical protein
MAQKKEKEFARRQHRSLALFLVIQCWVKKTDGLILKRPQLERFISLERFRDKRIKWLEIDPKEFFPYQKYVHSGTPETLSRVYVSRLPLEKYSSEELTNPKELIEESIDKHPRIALLSMWSKPKAKDIEKSVDWLQPLFTDLVNYDERLLSAYLSLLAQGQIRVQNIPSLVAKKGY